MKTRRRRRDKKGGEREHLAPSHNANTLQSVAAKGGIT